MLSPRECVNVRVSEIERNKERQEETKVPEFGDLQDNRIVLLVLQA